MVVTLAFKRRNLPHWLVADHAYFVTIRLHDTLPADVLSRLREARAQREHDFPNDPDRQAEAEREDFDHWCRDQESLERAMLYTIRNPVKAGLASSQNCGLKSSSIPFPPVLNGGIRLRTATPGPSGGLPPSRRSSSIA